jgi:hypothetical protein
MIACPYCTLQTTSYKVLISSHYNSKHKNIPISEFKLQTLIFNNIPFNKCETCGSPIVSNLSRKRRFCSRECYAPKTGITKKCSKCNKIKTLCDFYKSNRNTLGVESICKECNSNKRKRLKRQHKKINPYNKIIRNIRSLLWHQLTNRGYTKRSKTTILLGIDFDCFKQYIESKLEPNMTWDNYGKSGWTIDHICPCTQAQNEEELYKLFHYSNCRPMWHKNNISKGNRKTLEAKQKCYELLNREWVD